MKAHLTRILGMVCMLFVLLTRTWGLHPDELGYFHLARENAAGAVHAEQWFRDVARQVRLFDERSYPAFQSCNAAKAVVDRRFDVSACQEDACSASQYTIRSFLDQNVSYLTVRSGPTKSRVCLP